MRRVWQPLNAGLFASAAFVGGVVPGVITSLVLRWLGLGRASGTAAGMLGFVAVALDVVARRGSPWARPLAVFRQVPRDYGHRLGPWRAAVRYGLRMGFGPTTILVSWVWWAAFVIGVLSGSASIVLGSLAFAVFRSIAMFVATRGVGDGVAMAARSAAIMRLERGAARVASMVVLLASGLAIVWSQR